MQDISLVATVVKNYEPLEVEEAGAAGVGMWESGESKAEAKQRGNDKKHYYKNDLQQHLFFV